MCGREWELLCISSIDVLGVSAESLSHSLSLCVPTCVCVSERRVKHSQETINHQMSAKYLCCVPLSHVARCHHGFECIARDNNQKLCRFHYLYGVFLLLFSLVFRPPKNIHMSDGDREQRWMIYCVFVLRSENGIVKTCANVLYKLYKLLANDIHTVSSTKTAKSIHFQHMEWVTKCQHFLANKKKIYIFALEWSTITFHQNAVRFDKFYFEKKKREIRQWILHGATNNPFEKWK